MANTEKTSLYKKMIMTAIGPVLVLGIVITWFCDVRFIQTIYDQAERTMAQITELVAHEYDEKWAGDYSLEQNKDNMYELKKGETEITLDNSIVDNIAQITNSEISLLYMDMRIHTTFKTSGGKRFSGICTNSETSASVLAGNCEFYKDIKILDEKYLVYYAPLHNGDGSVVGMIEIAMKSADMKADVWRAVWPILLLSIGGMALAAYVSYRGTKEIVVVIKKIQKFLKGVESGDLQTEYETKVLARKDELGDIAKASTAMQKSIRSYVETDPLTKLGNRRYINTNLEKIKAKALESGVPFSVAIGDIDFFKKVNDTYGHNAGDEVLKAVASTLKRMMQGKGFAGRWGGEEFIMVFDKLAMEDAGRHLEKILENIRDIVVETEGFEIKVTMTFGVVTGSDKKSTEMVEAADAKLYYGKQNGRNQVVVNMSEESEEAIEEVAEPLEISETATDSANEDTAKSSKPKTSKTVKKENDKKRGKKDE